MGVRSETGQATKPASSGLGGDDEGLSNVTSSSPSYQTNMGEMQRVHMPSRMHGEETDDTTSGSPRAQQELTPHPGLTQPRPGTAGWSSLAFENLWYDPKMIPLQFHSPGLTSGFPGDDF